MVDLAAGKARALAGAYLRLAPHEQVERGVDILSAGISHGVHIQLVLSRVQSHGDRASQPCGRMSMSTAAVKLRLMHVQQWASECSAATAMSMGHCDEEPIMSCQSHNAGQDMLRRLQDAAADTLLPALAQRLWSTFTMWVYVHEFTPAGGPASSLRMRPVESFISVPSSSLIYTNGTQQVRPDLTM